jgi:DNA-3-methyladenine glycosylase
MKSQKSSLYLPISDSFYCCSTTQLAKKLIGIYLVHEAVQGRTVGKIVETEAYLSSNDPASHSAKGMTARNQIMFEGAGIAYVYFIYGMYYCFNVVSGVKGKGEAVLIRALEPIEGVQLMQERRQQQGINNLTNGPGKLTIAMGITKAHNGLPLDGGALYLGAPKEFEGNSPNPRAIITATRIGIKLGAELPLRFYLKNNPYVSKNSLTRN